MSTPISPDTPALPFPATKRPRGRSLSDFVPLRPAEKQLLDCCETGEEAKIGDTVPTADADPKTIVRADFLRFLMLGGDEQAPVHEKGVQLIGAWVQEDLDLASCSVSQGVGLAKCRFDGVIYARDAHIKGVLLLSGSHLRQGLVADRLRCDGGIFLSDDFCSLGQIWLLGAQIYGDLNCSNGRLKHKAGVALCLDGVVIKGNAFLNGKFEATGEVRLVNADISGDLQFTDGKFAPIEGGSISTDGVVVKGNVFFCGSFKATGAVRLIGAQIGGDLDCGCLMFSASFEDVLHLQSATVQNVFNLCFLASSVRIMATSAQVGVLIDANEPWAKGSILDGFVYKSLGGMAPTDAAARIEWLKKQVNEDLGEDKSKRNFRPQPWKQLQKVLREMGHDADAREVGVDYENQLRKADRIGQIIDVKNGNRWIPFLRRKCLRALHWLFGFLAGYGYHPLRLFMSLVWVWLFCGVIYWWLAYAPHSAIGPTDPLVFQNSAYQACTTENNGNWMLCRQLPAEYTTFSPLAYSLDVLLPLVDLGQEKRWGPLVPTPASHFCIELLSLSPPHWVRLLNWFQILYGWIASLLFVAIVSGMSRRSEMDK
jgi:hypothetical protein